MGATHKLSDLSEIQGAYALRLLHDLERSSTKCGVDETEIWHRNVLSRRFRRPVSYAWLRNLIQLLILIAQTPRPLKQKAKSVAAALLLALEVHHEWMC